jgi:hypothetical protein
LLKHAKSYFFDGAVVKRQICPGHLYVLHREDGLVEQIVSLDKYAPAYKLRVNCSDGKRIRLPVIIPYFKVQVSDQ